MLVVPEQPTASDLQAAFTTAAGLGQLTSSNLGITLLPAGQLTPAIQESTTLILVGLPSALPLLTQIEWPAPIVDNLFDVPDAQTDDGLLQMAISPWNPEAVVMSVSGTSATGLIKAAQAVSQGTIQVGTQIDLAIVAAIDPPAIAKTEESIDRTLADLGYTDQELNGRGRQTVEYEFHMPTGHIVNNEAAFNLFFSHSNLLNYDQSGIIVRLNDRKIGSIRFDNTDNPKQARIALPRSVLHTGTNHLTIHAEVIPLSECTNPDFESAWVTLWSESNLSIPLQPIAGGVRPMLDLSDFPIPFDNEPTLKDVAIIVPSQDPAAWGRRCQNRLSLRGQKQCRRSSCYKAASPIRFQPNSVKITI